MNYNFESFINLLKLTHGYSSHIFDNLRIARVLAKTNNVESHWYDDYKNKEIKYWKLDLNKESAYDDCVAINIYFDKEKNLAIFKLTLYDRSSWSTTNTKRSSYLIHLTSWSEELKPYFNSMLNSLTEGYLEIRKEEKQKRLYSRAQNKILQQISKPLNDEGED